MLKLLIRGLLRLLYRIEVHGALPQPAKTLIVGNHQSFLDAPIMWSILPDDTLWVVHSQVMKQLIFRLLVRVTDHIVIDTTNPFALKSTVDVIEAGRKVIIFPEGRVTVTGSLMKIYDGPAFIAAKTGATVAPFILDGAVRAKGFSRMEGDYPLAWFPKIKVTFFPGEVIPMPEAPSGKLRRRKAGEAMQRLLQRCLALSKPKRTLHEAFLEAIELHGRGRRMVEDAGGADLTYSGVLKGSLALGRLVSKITAENEVVGVLMPNAAATLCLALGLFGVRRIPAMLNFTAGVDGMQSALRAAKVKTILTSRQFLEKGKLTAVVEKLQGINVVFLEDLRAKLTLGDKLWLIFYALPFPRAATKTSQPDEPAVVLFTSGSEGKPKGVVLSHWAILSDIEQVFSIIDVSRADKILSAMPVFHSFGLTAGFMLPIVSGLRLFLYPSPLHYSIVPELFYDRDATVMFATPTFLKHYAKRAHPYDFRKVKMLLGGAEKLTDEIRNTYMDKFGVRVLEGYGATECAPVIAVNTAMRYKAGTVGEILPLMEWKLEKVPGIEEGGLLHVKGPNVMLGYWRESNPCVLEPPESVFGPGWYPTGDLAVVDSDGFLQLRGRVKRFAKVAGEMISLEVVEKIAEAASPKHIHGAVTRPDAGRGEMIVLCTQDKDLKRDQLQAAAREMGAPELAIPRRIVYIDKIPLLGTGKKDYPKLSQLVEAQLEQSRA
ncbi:AMP-binding protein [Paludibaculum fermentans]|uniref:AMP-binding protein n=1 Tax=Paludibaculum fermentans TaxID=1473598 RepID=A0A7S7NR10_PALFE|nr:AMP-binding protein [Paludibaculum fermentans]QOY88235.1 AMP-binding protein [Paludibaculum fermentans]